MKERFVQQQRADHGEDDRHREEAPLTRAEIQRLVAESVAAAFKEGREDPAGARSSPQDDQPGTSTGVQVAPVSKGNN